MAVQGVQGKGIKQSKVNLQCMKSMYTSSRDDRGLGHLWWIWRTKTFLCH